MWGDAEVVDADGHVMEPLWLWPQYVEKAFRDRVMHVVRDPVDGDKLVVDGRPSTLIRRLGGVAPRAGAEIPDWNTLPPSAEFASYQESCTRASWDGAARADWLDANGIDATLLFPSLGLIWPREVDPAGPWAVAHVRAYNRWILDMAADGDGRLVPVAPVPLTGDPGQASAELSALRDQGFAHVMLPVLDRPFADPLFERFFAAAEDLELAVHLHKVALPHFLETPSPLSLRSSRAGRFFNHVNEILPGQLCLAALLDAGVPDRFPRLRFAFHECNAGWLPAWLDRAQESFETLGPANAAPALPPAAYLLERDTFFFSVGVAEDLSAVPDVLAGRLLMATDYPHPGTPVDCEQAWRKATAGLRHSVVAGLLGGNAQRLLGR